MDPTYTYHPGCGERKEASNIQIRLSKLYKIPVVGRIVKKRLYEAYGLGNTVKILPGFHCDTAYLTVGENSCLSDVYIHGLGDVTIGSNVSIAKKCEIITGMHDTTEWSLVILKPTIIEDYACLFRGAKVLHDVKIGRGAYVGAETVVRSSVPPYSIVCGNPCKVIGFRFTPDEALEFEKNHFPENQRIDIEVLKSNYQKFFLKRLRDIKEFYAV